MKNAKVLSALGLMSLASTAALAASGPTLGSVLDASGVKVSGNVAVSLRQNVSVRDEAAKQARSNFQVDQGLLSIAYQPKEGFGGVVDLATGETVGQGGDVGGSTAGVVLSQAYLQYKSGDLTLIGGRYYTAAGYEVFPAAGNLFVTRSATFGLEPTYHTGVRASYAVSDSLSVFGGLNNGVYAGSNNSEQPLIDFIDGLQSPPSCVDLTNASPAVTSKTCDAYASTLKNKGVELGVTFAPISDLSLSLTSYHGKAIVNSISGSDLNKSASQNLYSFTATYKLTSALTLAANFDQANFYASVPAPFDNAFKYNAYAGYVTYALSDATTLGVRLEEISYRRSVGTKNNVGTATAVLSHSFAKNFDLRTELSDVDAQRNVGDTPDNRHVQLAVQGLLKF